MPYYKVAAFYQFAALPDFRELREPLRAICADLQLKGSVLLEHEGINGTLAGPANSVSALVDELQHGPPEPGVHRPPITSPASWPRMLNLGRGSLRIQRTRSSGFDWSPSAAERL